MAQRRARSAYGREVRLDRPRGRRRRPSVSGPRGPLPGMPFHTYDGPPFERPEDVHAAPYRHPFYARAVLPDVGAVDGAVTRWTTSHLLLTWVGTAGGEREHARVPIAWTRRIAREESGWRDPDDLH